MKQCHRGVDWDERKARSGRVPFILLSVLYAGIASASRGIWSRLREVERQVSGLLLFLLPLMVEHMDVGVDRIHMNLL